MAIVRQVITIECVILTPLHVTRWSSRLLDCANLVDQQVYRDLALKVKLHSTRKTALTKKTRKSVNQ